MSNRPPPQSQSLLPAVLHVLSEEGPNPTWFRAAPSAEYLCNGRVMRTAPGWWPASACNLEVSSSREEGYEEVVTLRFEGLGVHCGQPWSWDLTTGVLGAGDRRLLLHEHTLHPFGTWLQSHAISVAREALIQRTAVHLGHQLAARHDLRVTIAGVLAFAGSLLGSTPTDSLSRKQSGTKPMWRPDTARSRTEDEAHHEVSTFHVLDETPRAAVLRATEANLTQGVAAFDGVYHVLDETPRGGAGNPLLPPLGIPMASFGRSQNSCRSQAQSTRALATAEAFANAFLQPTEGSSQAESDGQLPTSSETAEKEQLDSFDDSKSALPKHLPDDALSSIDSGSSTVLRSLDDEVDLLRARMPDRSTATLREMVRQQHH